MGIRLNKVGNVLIPFMSGLVYYAGRGLGLSRQRGLNPLYVGSRLLQDLPAELVERLGLNPLYVGSRLLRRPPGAPTSRPSLNPLSVGSRLLLSRTLSCNL